MVSALLSDALEPRGAQHAIVDLFCQHPIDQLDTFPLSVEHYFREIFTKDEALDQIPPLCIQRPPESHSPGSLVRFRAMVQDTSPSPEIYLARSSDGKAGGWGLEDLPNASDDHQPQHPGEIDYSNLRDRSVFFAVNVPNEAEWYRADPGVSTSISAPPTPTSTKYPIPGQPHIFVQVKAYSTVSTFKPTQITTFVGILTKESFQNDDLTDDVTPISTLHVLFSDDSQPFPLDHLTIPNDSVAALRNDLLQWIARESLGGDLDAAESILLATIARVQSRTPPVLPPSLTISHFPSPPPPSGPADVHLLPTLSYIFSLLYPTSSTLPLTLGYLNTHPFTPFSNGDDLHSGVLQLPAGTVILLTEFDIAEGKVEERGLKNIKAVQDVLSTQTLHYTFPFSSFPFPTELNFVVLTQGRKSTFLETTTTLPLRPSSSVAAATLDLYKPSSSVSLPPPEKLDAFRALIYKARSAQLSISDVVSEHIQSEFVKERQADRRVTADDLIERMTTARLMALSTGSTELTIDTWERSVAFEKRRKSRIS